MKLPLEDGSHYTIYQRRRTEDISGIVAKVLREKFHEEMRTKLAEMLTKAWSSDSGNYRLHTLKIKFPVPFKI